MTTILKSKQKTVGGFWADTARKTKKLSIDIGDKSSLLFLEDDEPLILL